MCIQSENFLTTPCTNIFALMFPNTELYLLFIPFPVKAKYMVGFYILMDIFGAIQNDPGDTVAHYAHLGGAFVGFVIVEFWKRQLSVFRLRPLAEK